MVVIKRKIAELNKRLNLVETQVAKLKVGEATIKPGVKRGKKLKE